MAVTSVNVDYAGRTGGDTSKGVRTYTAKWIVRTSVSTDGQTTVLADQRLPRQLQYYQYGGEVDRQALVQSRTAEQDDQSPTLWRVTIEYSTEASGQSNTPEFSKSIDLTPKYSWGSYTEDEVVYRDIRGKPVVNSSGEMFDPPLVRPVGYPLLRISRAELNFNPLVIMAFKGAINNSTWGPWPAFSAKCVDISANQEVQEGLQFWRVSYEFAFKLREAPSKQVGSTRVQRSVYINGSVQKKVFEVPNDDAGGWVEYTLDRGTMGRELEPRKAEDGSIPSQSDLVLGAPAPLRDFQSNSLVSSPVLLDGAGGRLLKNGTALNLNEPNSPQPIYIPFHICAEKDFNLLQINPNPA